MLTPFQTQIDGALFLANRKNALLADEPRVGKTGAAIMAADYNLDDSILVVTTASGRPVWRRGFRDWSTYNRSVFVQDGKAELGQQQIAIVGWPSIADNHLRAVLLCRQWDRLILDESHYAKSFEARRTQAAFGELVNDGAVLANARSLIGAANGVWCLSGTPMPNSPADLYPMMRALFPERLAADDDKGWPDVRLQADFMRRYCIIKLKKLPRGFRRIPVVIGGRNLPELRARLEGLILRRTQADVGIGKPIYETLPLLVSDRMRRDADSSLDHAKVLAAAERGDTKELEIALGTLRRFTGEIKARAVVQAVKDEFDGGLDKIVLAYWHKDVGSLLAEGLSTYGVVRLDGSTSPTDREKAETRFRDDPSIRVFLGQIQAAGEAIDLSAAATLWFVETSLIPKDQKQMALRVTNYTQKRQVVVRVCVIDGSIDDALQQILMRKWTAIREVLTQ